MSETKRFFIFGAGYSGKALARSRPEGGVELFVLETFSEVLR